MLKENASKAREVEIEIEMEMERDLKGTGHPQENYINKATWIMVNLACKKLY